MAKPDLYGDPKYVSDVKMSIKEIERRRHQLSGAR